MGQHLTAVDVQRFQQILQQQGFTDTGENVNAYAASADQLESSAEVGEITAVQDSLIGSSVGGKDSKVDGEIGSKAGDRYVFIPVHPWQWEHQLESVYARQLMDGDIVYLGPSSSPYRAAAVDPFAVESGESGSPLHQAGP